MRSPHPDHPRVFISYSHDSPEHLDRVLELAEEACLDEADHLVRNTKGFAKVKRIYDDRGNVTEEAYFGPNGRLEYYEERYVKIRLKRNPQGNPVELVFLDATDAARQIHEMATPS